MKLNLSISQDITEHCLRWSRKKNLRPITVAVLDQGGYLISLVREDGSSNLRPDIAQGKAKGALLMGMGSRSLFERAKKEPFFIQAMNSLADGSLVPVAGGVLIKKGDIVLGAVGITGDSSDNAEACAIEGIHAVGFVADGG